MITGVADRMKERLRHAVYLDAFVPADGDSPASLTAALANPGAAAAEIAAETAAEIARRRSAVDERGGIATHYTNMFDVPPEPAERYRWVERRITLHPARTRIEPMRLPNGGSDGLPRTYILCAGSEGETPFMVLARRLRGDPSWRCRELPTGHDAMVTMPEETAALLIEAAGP